MKGKYKLILFSSLIGLVFMLFIDLLIRLEIEHKVFPQEPDDLWEYIFLSVLVLVYNAVFNKSNEIKKFMVDYAIGLLCAVFSMNLVGFILLFY